MRMFSFMLPLVLVSADAIPVIPVLRPAAPATTGIVVTPDGTVYFVDSFQNMVWRAHAGRAATPFVTGSNGRALQLDEAGNVYGTHEDDGRLIVWRADRNGVITERMRTDLPDGHNHIFVFDEDGDVLAPTGSSRRSGVRLWRATQHEMRLVAGGEFGLQDGVGANARFFPIGGMTRTPDGDVLVTSGATIRRIASDGSVRTVVSGERLLQPRHPLLARLAGDGHAHLMGIAVGPRGEIYVANGARDALIRVMPDGTTEEVLKSDGPWTPTGVAVSNGVVYVLEYGPGVRVRRLMPNGTVSTIAMVRPERIASASLSFGRVEIAS